MNKKNNSKSGEISFRTHADVTITVEYPTNHKIYFRESNGNPAQKIELTYYLNV